jgi:hypothetical protein
MTMAPKRGAEPESLPPSPQHKFKIGQLVHYHPKKIARFRPEGLPWLYQITRLLPATEDGEFRYEIRSTLEEHDRGARESELARN